MKLYSFPDSVAKIIKKAEKLDSTLLITGQSGSGKSLLAKWIHERSNRCECKFVSINLATLSENLLESELFGHERGAFSGADTKRMGKLEYGNNGTVFLDEIGELTPRLQTKLLDFLQNKTIVPVGSNQEKKLNVRIIVATNQNLEKLVAEGKFREDLFYRLNIFRVEMPTLASDPERVVELTKEFIFDANNEFSKNIKGLDAESLKIFREYSWTGNVRELKNTIEYSVAMADGEYIVKDDLPQKLQNLKGNKILNFTNNNLEDVYEIEFASAKQKFEKNYLSQMLANFGGRINLTSERTGISKVTLISKIREYDIDVNFYKLRAV